MWCAKLMCDYITLHIPQVTIANLRHLTGALVNMIQTMKQLSWVDLIGTTWSQPNTHPPKGKKGGYFFQNKLYNRAGLDDSDNSHCYHPTKGIVSSRLTLAMSSYLSVCSAILA